MHISNEEQPRTGLARNKMVIIIAAVLLILVAGARLFFGLPREITHVALSVIVIGVFLFGLIDSLRSHQPILTVLALVVIVSYAAMLFM